MERLGDTRTIAPTLMYKNAWGLDLNLNLGLDAGNFNQLTIGGRGTFYRNLEDLAYYVQAEYSYRNVNWSTLQHRAGGTFRADFNIHEFSDQLKLSMGLISTALYDDLMLINLRATAGAGPWLNFESDNFINGFSVFLIGEHEDFEGFPDETAMRLSFRNISIIPVNDSSRFIVDTFYVPNLEDMEDVRFSLLASFNFAISKMFSLSLSAVYEYDSRPKPGIENYDFKALAGIGLTLGPPED